ncbi:hypothetical protein N665_0809s0057 [Sinapis alba]|nr:hypothetical protein N665_0809s0057 [Sinapis alba]
MSVREIISSVVLVILITASSAVDIEFDESPRIRGVSNDSLREVEESFVQILGQSRHVLSFARFTHNYGKMYQNDEEIKHRFSVFKENLDFIRSTNKKGLSYKLGVNQFADLTFQEFHVSNSSAAQDSFATLKGSHNLTLAVLPAIMDWRLVGFVSRVKNQGLCGASWAFSATGVVESAYYQYVGIRRELSEQQLIDCSYRTYGTQGCVGGLPWQAFDYIKSHELTSEQQYPYSGVRGICRSRLPPSRIKGQVRISAGEEQTMKHVIGTIGPISISFVVTRSMMFYSEGVYTDPRCFSDVIQYALAVGYGTENGIEFWIIKNSWGTSWGLEGYLKLRKGMNLCGVARNAFFVRMR